jgi:hypothetical protein
MQEAIFNLLHSLFLFHMELGIIGMSGLLFFVFVLGMLVGVLIAVEKN